MEASVCWALAAGLREWKEMRRGGEREAERERVRESCLLYTSDAADE